MVCFRYRILQHSATFHIQQLSSRYTSTDDVPYSEARREQQKQQAEGDEGATCMIVPSSYLGRGSNLRILDHRRCSPEHTVFSHDRFCLQL